MTIVNMNAERYYKISEVAKMLDVHQQTLRQWEESGKLVPDKKDKQRLYSATQLRGFLRDEWQDVVSADIYVYRDHLTHEVVGVTTKPNDKALLRDMLVSRNRNSAKVYFQHRFTGEPFAAVMCKPWADNSFATVKFLEIEFGSGPATGDPVYFEISLDD